MRPGGDGYDANGKPAPFNEAAMIRAIVETPYAAAEGRTVEQHARYLRLVLRFCLQHGMAPFASHGFYTLDGLLDDGIPWQRKLGMEAGFAWSEVAQVIVVGMDCGISPGMAAGIARHEAAGIPIRRLWLGPDWDSRHHPNPIKAERWEQAA